MTTGGIQGSEGSGGIPLFEIRDDGTVKLASGRVYKVEIDHGGSSTSLGSDHKALTEMIVEILKNTQEQGFTYKDLSHTFITHEGVHTDQKTEQKELSEREITLITPENFNESYQAITDTAQEIFKKMPDPSQQSKTILSGKPNDQSDSPIGEEVPEPRVETSPSSSLKSTPSQSVKNPSKTFQVSVAQDPMKALEEEGGGTIKFREVKRSTDEVAGKVLKEAKPNVFVRTFKKVVKFFKSLFSKQKGSPSSEDAIKPEKKEVRAKSLKVDKKEKKSELASSQLTTKTMIEVKFADDTVKQFESDEDLSKLENIIKTKEVKVPIAKVPLLELDRIVSNAMQIGGKIKIREGTEKGSLVLRAGDRKWGLNKRTDASGESTKAIELVIGSIRNAFDSFSEKKTQLQQSVSFLKALPTIDGDSAPTDEELIAWIKQAENLKEVIENDKIQEFIEAATQCQEEPESVEKMSQFATAAKELNESLVEKSDEIETKIHKELAALRDEVRLIYSIIDRIENNIPWSKGVLENNDSLSEEIGANKVLWRSQLSDLEQVQTALSDKTGGLTGWISKKQALTDLLDPEKAEFRGIFMSQYRWYMKTPELITFLNDQFNENQTLLASGDADVEMDAVVEKQKVILEILSNWAREPKINPEEIQLLVDRDSTVEQVIQAMIQTAEEGGFYQEQISQLKESLENPITPSTVPTLKDDAPSFVQELSVLHKNSLNPFDKTKKKKKELLNNYTSELLKLFRNEFRTIQMTEVTGLAWSKEGKETEAPNLTKNITLATRNTFATVHQILTVPDDKGGRRNATKDEARNLLAFFIDVQTKCIEDGEMNAAMSIQAALHHSSISRLKDSWSKIDQPHMEKFEKNCERLDHSSSYKAMREYVKNTENSAPYLGMVLSDLTFIHEGNPSKKEEGEVLWNLGKLGMLSDSVKTLQKSQGDGSMQPLNYNLQGDIDQLSHKEGKELKDDDVYKISLEIQPRKTQ